MDIVTVSEALSRGELLATCAVAALVGFVSHIAYWVWGHHDQQTTRVVAFHVVAFAAACGWMIWLNGLLQGLVYGSAVWYSYLGSLFTSMTIYRLFFHPLRRFPGPFAAKITKLYGPWMARKGKMHEEHFKMVRKYGDFVRSGPNEMILFHIDALEIVHGGRSRCNKTRSMYDYFDYKGEKNLDSIQYREPHRGRRQVWDKAIGPKALETYEIYAKTTIREWLQKLDDENGRPINSSLYSLLIPVDVIGKVGYSRNWNSVKEGKPLPIMKLVEHLFRTIGTLGHLDWPLPLSSDLKLGKEQAEFEELAVRMIEERDRTDDGTQDDMVKYFLEDLRSEKPKAFFNRNVLHSDSQAILIGGGPTIGSALGYTWFYLASHPAVRTKLRDAVMPAYGKTTPDEFRDADLAKVEYLVAVLDEVMRIISPGGSNAPRTTPPEGITVNNVYIPGNVKIFTPIYAFGRSEKYFKKAEEFIPERWTTRQDLIIDRRAYFPFLLGPMNCVGKRLALMQLRLVVAYTLREYDFQFAPGEDGSDIFAKSRNQLVIKPGKLDLVFKRLESDSRGGF